jgi:hypothetical protein
LLTSKGQQGRLVATDAGVRPGGFPLGSAQSRAAARAMLAARKASEEGPHFQVVTRSIVDGSRLNLDGLAERLGAALKRNEAGQLTDAPPERAGGRKSEGTWEERLEERMRRGRERVAAAEALDGMR